MASYFHLISNSKRGQSNEKEAEENVQYCAWEGCLGTRLTPDPVRATTDEDCATCYTDTDRKVILQNCDHWFCLDCMYDFATEGKTHCPLCKRPTGTVMLATRVFSGRSKIDLFRAHDFCTVVIGPIVSDVISGLNDDWRLLVKNCFKSDMGNSFAISQMLYLFYFFDALGHQREDVWPLFALSKDRTTGDPLVFVRLEAERFTLEVLIFKGEEGGVDETLREFFDRRLDWKEADETARRMAEVVVDWNAVDVDLGDLGSEVLVLRKFPGLFCALRFVNRRKEMEKKNEGKNDVETVEGRASGGGARGCGRGSDGRRHNVVVARSQQEGEEEREEEDYRQVFDRMRRSKWFDYEKYRDVHARHEEEIFYLRIEKKVIPNPYLL